MGVSGEVRVGCVEPDGESGRVRAVQRRGCLANKPQMPPPRADVTRAALLSAAQVRVHRGGVCQSSVGCGGRVGVCSGGKYRIISSEKSVVSTVISKQTVHLGACWFGDNQTGSVIKLFSHPCNVRIPVRLLEIAHNRKDGE